MTGGIDTAETAELFTGRIEQPDVQYCCLFSIYFKKKLLLLYIRSERDEFKQEVQELERRLESHVWHIVMYFYHILLF